jgi:hypothetical protein
MKTTLDINDTLLVSAKALAVQQRTTLTRLMEEGLQLRLRAANTARSAKKARTPVLAIYKGKGGLLPGVNPLSNKAMLDRLDEDGVK